MSNVETEKGKGLTTNRIELIHMITNLIEESGIKEIKDRDDASMIAIHIVDRLEDEALVTLDMKIDGTHLAKLREEHGAALSLRLCVFYETWNNHGEAAAKESVDRTTYYRYRKILAEAGDLDINQYSQRRWISSGRRSAESE